MTYPLRQLIEQLEAVDAQIATLRESMYHEKLAEARALVEEFGFTAYELGLVRTQHIGRKRGPTERTFKQRMPAPAKPVLYRDPATGATWSGQGRRPNWIRGHKEDYLIENLEESK